MGVYRMKKIIFLFIAHLALISTIFSSDSMQQFTNDFTANRLPGELAESRAHRRVAQTVDAHAAAHLARLRAATAPTPIITTTSTVSTDTTRTLILPRRVPGLESTARNIEYLTRFRPALNAIHSQNLDASVLTIDKRLDNVPALKHELIQDFMHRLTQRGHFKALPCIKEFKEIDATLMAATVCKHTGNNPAQVAVFLAKDNTVYCRSLGSEEDQFPPINLPSPVVALDACATRMAFATNNQITICDINDLEAHDIISLDKLTCCEDQFTGFVFGDEDTIIATTNNSNVIKYKLCSNNRFSKVAQRTLDTNFTLGKIIFNQTTQRCFISANDNGTQTGALFIFDTALNLTNATLLDERKITDFACTSTGKVLSIAHCSPDDLTCTNVAQYTVSDAGKCVQTPNLIIIPVNGEQFAKLCYLEPSKEYPDRHALLCTGTSNLAFLKSASLKLNTEGNVPFININSNRLTQTNIGTIPGTGLLFANNQILTSEFPLEAACVQSALDNATGCLDIQRIQESAAMAELMASYKNYFSQEITAISRNFGPMGFVRNHPYLTLFILRRLVQQFDYSTESLLPKSLEKFNIYINSVRNSFNYHAISTPGFHVAPAFIFNTCFGIATGKHEFGDSLSLYASKQLERKNLISHNGALRSMIGELGLLAIQVVADIILDNKVPANQNHIIYKILEPYNMIRELPAQGKLVTSIAGTIWLLSLIRKQ